MNKPNFIPFNWQVPWKVLLSVSILLLIAGVVLVVFFQTPSGKWMCYTGIIIVIVINSFQWYANVKNQKK